ncbi:pyocin activator PrtN family protein [Pseudomonas aeruginosa]|uniref:pyocin activator PrtN family protein n=1 Tax=Pseudomonas aeruginosa TaxID=287 RepID=UPI0018C83876|nr:pyocin activator PrtN family protein [Pseudomonas aeruginosa]EIU1659415.1 pyocin activator PrtN family protein [Pseudomonas aeruginosa]EKU6905725.1 pyocin activator PrtN family protein [Pseudomonas aeruginosa]EKV8015249.1 pyocin activator PrtN family protein [Pseudomonas aeruginosa]MBG5800418.1 pyocin activator PrtN family protein [Pseudomonas aeruginosa]MBP8321999.1 pyocin activator PrtN family protein [Pseudomonas aeruginosa]
MNTLFLLMAQYDGAAIIPLERVCADYFSHLTPEKMKMKVAAGEIDLPLVRMENSQKSARGVHLADLANYLDERHRTAKEEHEKLMGRRTLRRAS